LAAAAAAADVSSVTIVPPSLAIGGLIGADGRFFLADTK